MEHCRTETVGLDIGDKHSLAFVLDADGDEAERWSIRTTKGGIEKAFSKRDRCVVALEAGSHSRWISAQIESYGHDVIVANPRMIPLIYASDDKTDQNDAERLARVARVDRKLLKPLTHRKEEYQEVLAVIKARDALVRARTRLITHCRGTIKSTGERLPTSSSDRFYKLKEQVADKRRRALDPVMDSIEMLTLQIKVLDETITKECVEEIPESIPLQQPHGVGPITALAFVATIEDPHRFEQNRNVAGFLGLRPRRAQSSESDPQMRITKAGNSYVRRLLVGSAQRILGPFGVDSDLRLWGLKLCARGGKNAKKRAVVAVARKLAVLLISLWKTQQIYDPQKWSKKVAEAETDSNKETMTVTDDKAEARAA